MGVFYNLSLPANEVVAKVLVGNVPGLHYVPNKNEQTKDLWPHGVSDGSSIGWFEDGGSQGIIHFWGANVPTNILAKLRAVGVKSEWGG